MNLNARIGIHGVSRKMIAAGILVSWFLSACNRPFHVWEAHTTATPLPSSFNVSTLTREQVVVLLPATSNHLQGYIPSLSQALTVACSETTPSIHLLSHYEIFNKVNHQNVVREYAEQDPSFAASRLLAPGRLKQIGTTLGAK